MKHKNLTFLLLLLPLFFSSCIFSPSVKGNGNVVEETRTVEPFSEIKVSRGMNVYISQGEQTQVLVKADENLLEAIETEVSGEKLTVTTNSNIRKASSKKVYVTTPHLRAIKSSSGAAVFSVTEINTNQLELSASAGSNMKLDIKTDESRASASAGANITLKGISYKFYGKASSGSNIKAEGLKTQNSETKVSSGANIWVSVDQSLEGNASSGGNIFYYGDPINTNINKSSGGNVHKTN